ncbi:glycoside hydrolase family 2 TIM barrel-domain containing protein [uncultured Draconibacterium sp.]|uniref:glycoside hydrolase family 2 TIM barrel-domain containing protein n=1 Tax=uncultured Draconibacterium sp. TaxID=1573823 RepID=UPI0032173E9B
MKKYLLFILITLCGVGTIQAAKFNRKVLFDNDWRFSLGSQTGAENPDFDDSGWRIIDLPHDWSIESLKNQFPDSIVGPFSKASIGGFATGQTVGGEGWYRKTFIIPKEKAGKRYELYFEGIYNQSEVWINGQKANINVYGYSSFRFDITQYCNPAGQKNTIAVKVLNEGENSRWYSGSGIYRHVWMITTEPIYIREWSTFITTKSIVEDTAHMAVSTTIINGANFTGNYDVSVEFFSKIGKRASEATKNISIENSEKQELFFNFEIKNPVLWSPATPNLYEAKITLKKESEIIDQIIIPFGIRTIKFSVDKGFELNGNTMLLKGGCVHHANGLLGAKAFDRAEERKIELLKKNGFNAVRTAHNPMSESFMNACDRLGMIVINEAFDQWNDKKNPDDYHQYFEAWSAKDIKNLVLRDRNHPSVIMWSIGNEISERITEKGRETAKFLKDEIRKYDNSRPVTAGVNKYWNKDRSAMLPLDNALVNLDISGYNYMWRFFEEEHEKWPGRVMYSSESVATEAAQNWDKVKELPYVIGDFIWTAMDYLGESGLGSTIDVDPEENVHQFQGWPWFNAWCGDLDLIGFKKPQSYYRDVLWGERDIIMAVEAPVAEGKIRKVSFWGWPEESLSWTFPGLEGKTLNVNVYSRLPKVKIYLNDKFIGEKATDDKYKATFEVPYQSGKLKAIAISGEKQVAETQLETVGKPAAINLMADRIQLRADGQDLSYVSIELVDANGNVILNDNRGIKINCHGVGQIIGSGNASPTDMKSFGSLEPNLFRGRAMVVVRSGKEAGKIKLIVSSNELPTTEIELRSK